MSYVIIFILCYLNITSIVLLIQSIKNIKFEKIISLIMMITIFALLLTVINYIDSTILKSSLRLLLYILITKIIFKGGYKEGIFNTFYIILIAIFHDIIIYLILSISKVNYNYESLLYISSISLSFVYYAMSKIKFIAVIWNKIKKAFKIGFKKKHFFMIEISCYIAVTCIIYDLIIRLNLPLYSLALFVLSTILIFIFQYQFFLSEKKEIEKVKLSKMNDSCMKIIEIDKEYKHNIRNKLIAVKSVASNEVEKLIDEIISDSQTHQNNILEFNNIPKEFLYIVYDKLYKLDNINYVFLNLLRKMTIKNMKIENLYQVIEALGICLDNAVQAIKDVDDPIIRLEFKEDDKNIVISLSNNFKGQIDISRLGEKYYSSKTIKSGLGLFSLGKMKNIKNEFLITDQLFTIKIICSK